MRQANPFLMDLSPAAAERLEELMSRFEESWQRGQRPELEDTLRQGPELHAALLVELALTDLEYRQQAGEQITAQDYAARFPELPWSRAPAPCAGQQFGRYRLEQPIGSGAFGSVFLARDFELDRAVAIKLPRSDLLPAEVDRERFLREARHAARLQHSAIVAVYDSGISEGMCYLVMEYVDGPTLADWLTTRRPEPRDAAALVAQLASALHHAHQRGVVHRDLKPANILLASVQPLVGKIADFGLARQLGHESPGSVDHYVVGTPAYLPPEALDDPAAPLGPAGDIYSLGAVLYELLTGRPPYEGNTAAVLRQLAGDEPRAPRDIDRAIARDLECICLRALASDPRQRYATAADFAADLRRYLRNEPVAARPLGWIGSCCHWCRRHRLIAGLAACVGGAVLVSGAGAGLLWRRAQHQQRLAEHHLLVARLALDDYTHLADANVRPRAADGNQRELVRQALTYYEYLWSNRPDDPALCAPLAQLYHAQGVFAKHDHMRADAHLAWQRALEFWDRAQDTQSPSTLVRWGLGRTCLVLAEDLERGDDIVQCHAYARRATGALRDACQLDPANEYILAMYVRAAMFEWRLHRRRNDRPAARRAAIELANTLRTQWRVHPSTAVATEIVGLAGSKCYESIAESEAAETERDSANAIQQWLELVVPDNLLHSALCRLESMPGIRLAEAYYRAGRKDDAEAVFVAERTWADGKRLAEPENRAAWKYAAHCRFWLGKIRQETGREREARDDFAGAVEVVDAAVAAGESPATLSKALGASLHSLGRLQLKLGEPDLAVHSLRRAVALREGLCQHDPEDLALQADLRGSRERLHEAEVQTSSQ